jgi:hypothetical protein
MAVHCIDCLNRRKRITELEQQLDDWKDKAMSERHDLNMCEREVERLREALGKYGMHMEECNVLMLMWDQDGPGCTCGLEQALITGL